jgi:hypothetical protein
MILMARKAVWSVITVSYFKVITRKVGAGLSRLMKMQVLYKYVYFNGLDVNLLHIQFYRYQDQCYRYYTALQQNIFSFEFR